MSVNIDNPAFEDQTTLLLRALFERYGYRRYRMGKFEPYDLYRENRNFLKSETVITFTDPTGRLMALKPDVTMSIVKNTPENAISQKLYYVENVFRMGADSREYREIGQVGLESIGEDGEYAEAEVVLLAVKTLKTVSREYLLCVSHMGITSAVFDVCGLGEADARLAMDALRHKNTQALSFLADRLGLSDDKRALLCAMTELSGSAEEVLPRLRGMVAEETEALRSIGELERLFAALRAADCADRARIDFTIVNDMDYYNGVVFQGYLEGLPRAVLSGGRYDNLMRRFGKAQSALGFALYLGELSRAARGAKGPDADLLLIYGDAPAEQVTQAMEKWLAKGLRVRAAKTPPPGVFAPKTVRINPDGSEEVTALD